MDVHRVVINMLHDGETLSSTRRGQKGKADKTRYSMVFSVGATKEGIAFCRRPPNKPELRPSAAAWAPHLYRTWARTYYVLLQRLAPPSSGPTPAKYVKEFEEKTSQRRTRSKAAAGDRRRFTLVPRLRLGNALFARLCLADKAR